MRSFVITAFALSTAALMSAAPASAAATWQCQGGSLACGTTPSVSQKTYKKVGTYKKAGKATHRKAVSRKAYGKRIAKVSYRKAKHASRRTNRVVATSGGGHSMSGVASFYWQPQPVASGGRFNPNALTAAHKTLPFGTKVRVTHLGNGRSVTVTINDRGPYIRGRIIDLSRRAAGVIGMTGSGVARVAVSVVGRS